MTTEYAIFRPDRDTEDDPTDVTVIYTMNGTDWYPMVSGPPSYALEVVEALCYREAAHREKVMKSLAELDALVDKADNSKPSGEWACYG